MQRRLRSAFFNSHEVRLRVLPQHGLEGPPLPLARTRWCYRRGGGQWMPFPAPQDAALEETFRALLVSAATKAACLELRRYLAHRYRRLTRQDPASKTKPTVLPGRVSPPRAPPWAGCGLPPAAGERLRAASSNAAIG